jgi:hypothetical protein
MRRIVVAGSASWSDERVSESWSPRMGIRVVTYLILPGTGRWRA